MGVLSERHLDNLVLYAKDPIGKIFESILAWDLQASGQNLVMWSPHTLATGTKASSILADTFYKLTISAVFL